MKETHFQLWLRNLSDSLSSQRIETTNRSVVITVSLHFVMNCGREIKQYWMNSYEYSGYGSTQPALFTFISSSILLICCNMQGRIENKYKNFFTKGGIIIFYLEGGTICYAKQHLPLGVRFFQNNDVNFAH